jgi:hypothetical protein
MRFNQQPVTGYDISGTEMPALAPTMSNSLSVTGAVGNPFAVSGLNYGYNGANWEFVRTNVSTALLAASSVSASTAISVTNYNARGIRVYMNVTGNFPPGSASTTIALKIQAVAPDGTNVLLGGSTAKSVSGMTTVSVFPGATESTGIATSQFNKLLSRNMRILASISTAAASFGCVLTLGVDWVV